MNITFCGGAQSVTGANYLLETDGSKILVDCGLYQGSKYAEDLNYQPFAYQAQAINCVLVTHSHIDHIGRLPKLYRDGFKGAVFAVEPTKELMIRALPNNWGLMVDEARTDNHEPLYNREDIDGLLNLVKTAKYRQKITLVPNLSVEFLNAGHILGSGIVCLEYQSSGQAGKICFTGDLGNSPSLLLPDKEFVSDADYLVIESAYGNRIHENRDQRSATLKEIIDYVVKNKGVLMIPSFAIERTQEIIFEINKLHEAQAIPELPVFIDSPLAIRMTEVYSKYQDYLNEGAKSFIGPGKNIFAFPGLKHTITVEESKKINDVPGPKIVIAGSGMSQGGRILHHERRYLPDPASAIVFIGYQVEGSLGRQIIDGQSEVKIFGEKVAVGCRVKGIGGYSAHADQPALLEWVSRAKADGKLKKVFVVQGEAQPAQELARLITEKLGIEALVPGPADSFDIF